VKAQFNFADRYVVSPNRAKRLFIGILVVLALWLAAQLLILYSLQSASSKLRPVAGTGSDTSGEKERGKTPPSEGQLAKQAGQIAFANAILRQDSFQWSVLLDRLEQTLADGVSLESVGPDPGDGSVKLVGRALKLDNLRGYLGGLSRSEWFSDAYLLEQATVDSKKPGEPSFIRFVIMVKEAF